MLGRTIPSDLGPLGFHHLLVNRYSPSQIIRELFYMLPCAKYMPALNSNIMVYRLSSDPNCPTLVHFFFKIPTLFCFARRNFKMLRVAVKVCMLFLLL